MSNIALLISGGVDSSVACHILVERDYKPHLFYIAIGPDKDLKEFDCKMEEDVEMCTWISKKYDLPFDIVSLHDEYWDMVMKYHIESLKMGETPNPDVLCNQLIKFGIFLERYGKSFDLVATGHYAHLKEWEGIKYLHTAKDKNKDQTYFLSTLSIEQLQHIHFPLAQLTKQEVRSIANELGFPNASRKGTSGICFIARNQYAGLIRSVLGTWEGDFVEYETGKKLGQHKGHWFFTIGQRKGLGLAGGPWFVVKKDPQQNVVYISKGYQPESVMQKHIYVHHVHTLFPAVIKENEYLHGFVKIRHTPAFSRARVIRKGKYVLIETEEPQHGVAPGQFAVMYDEKQEFVLFSGEMTYPDI